MIRLAITLIFLCACVPLTPAPFQTPTPEVWTETPTPAPQRGVIVDVSTYLNVRVAPDILSEIVGRLYAGDVVYIVGNSADGNWLETTGGWIFAAYVRLEL